jgi:hypothetical protein
MAWVGAAAYTPEYVSARRRLCAAFGGGIEVVHSVPVLAAGIQGTWDMGHGPLGTYLLGWST